MTVYIKERVRTLWVYLAVAVALTVGLYVLFTSSFFARAVSGVSLADNDTTGYGVDGRDFNVSWTSGSSPDGYIFTQIYIVSSSITLTTSTLGSACTGNQGNVCAPLDHFTSHNRTSTTLTPFFKNDSNGTAWNTSTPYVAWVFVSSTIIGNGSIVSSTPVTTTFDTPVDNSPPFVDHAPVHGATANVTGTIHAMIFDDQTSDDQFASTTDGGAESFYLYYGANVASSVSVATGTQVAGALFQFSVPPGASGVPTSAGGVFQYYFIARDATGNARYVCTSPSANSTSSCQASPFSATTVAAGSRTISGTITNDGSNLGGVTVFVGGFASAATSSSSTGAYTLIGLPDNDAFDITAMKMGYCRNTRNETIGTTNKTGVNLSLNFGSCSGGSGGGSPLVNFSGPANGSNNVAPNEKIRVGLSQVMNGSTINDNDAANTGSNIYLTTDDGTTKIAGSVVYCENSSSPGCSSLASQDTNTILFLPTSNLATSTFYTLVITERVTSQGGQSVSGNRTGGGNNTTFTTGGGSFSAGQFTLGSGGQFMPPYVRSMVPKTGVSVAPNVKIAVEFNKAMDSATINTTNFVLVNKTTNVTTTLSSVTLDSNEKRFVAITPQSAFTSGNDYELQVLGGVANPSGVAMRPPLQSGQVAFRSFFKVAGSNDATAPTIYPLTASGTTGVAVNSRFEFGFSEPMDFNTLNTTNITLSRSSAVGVIIKYDLGKNSVYVIPSNKLNPNTVHTLVMAGLKDLAGNIVPTSTFTYTTGAVDTTAPALMEARCDDYTCSIRFNERMNNDSKVDSNFASSTLNHLNFTLMASGTDKIVTSTSMTYDAILNSVVMEGLSLTKDSTSTLSITGLTDLSENALPTQNMVVPIEDSAKTFGSFGGQGMFAPPTSEFTGSVGGGEFQPQGFGSFTAEQFALGQAARAFPFNPTAGQDSNIFQVQFTPGVILQNGDVVQFTYPDGTTITNAALDTMSPFNKDMNKQGAGTVTGTVAVSAGTNAVSVTLGIVSGTTGPQDTYMVDLRKIINPSIPKDSSSGGYTIGIKVSRGTTVLVNKTSMPYFVKTAGTNSVTIKVIAGSGSGDAGATGSLNLFAGGPSGALNKTLTMTDGAISSVEGTAVDGAVGHTFSSLSDGCYFFGTDPLATLGSTDYFGLISPQPVCVNGGQSSSKTITLTSASAGSGSATATIKLAGIANFGGVDIDIFAGGPGRYVVKTLSAVAAPNGSGYNIKLPSNGRWFVGVGPAMPKGSSSGQPKPLSGVPPASVELVVSGVGTASSSVSLASNVSTPGASFNDTTDVLTFTFAAADKTITGTVTDGTTGLPNVNMFAHRQGFGAPVQGTTNASGTFSLAVSDFGSYQIGAMKDGLPPTEQQVEVRSDGLGGADVYFKGQKVTGGNPLTFTIKKSSYTISGKVLDSSSAGISGASVSAVNSTGQSVWGLSSADGSYTLFADAGTWTVKAELPPDKTDTCGTLSLSVTVTTESKSSQNLSPSDSTCYTLSGTVSVNSVNLTSVPVFVMEWDTTNNRPAGGMRPGTTDSSGLYTFKVAGNKTYRVGMWDPDNGEIGVTKAVVTSNATADLTLGALATTTFAFTGGTSDMTVKVDLVGASSAISKQKTGLDTSLQINTPSSATYSYFIDVKGIGKFNGSLTSGTTTTIDLGLQSTNFVTVTGTIKDGSGNALSGVQVTFTNTSTLVVETVLTDVNGQYTQSFKAGNYTVGSNISGYTSGEQAQTVSFTTTTIGYDFGGATPDQAALQVAAQTISGILRDSTGVALAEGTVWAQKTTASTTVTASISPTDGSYTLAVTTGTWRISGVAPNHAKTTMSGTVIISGANSSGNTFNLTAATGSANVPTSTTAIVAADAGGSVNDAGTGIKLTGGAGVLGSTDVTIDLKRQPTAPDTETFLPLASAAFEINVTESGAAKKDFNGNVELQFNYDDLISQLPSNVSESDLKLMYLSNGAYVPVEGGFTVNTASNTISGLVDHATDFVIAYVPAASSGSGSSNTTAASSGGSAGGTPILKPSVPEPIKLVAPPAATTTVATTVKTTASGIALSNVPTKAMLAGAVLKYNYTYSNTGSKLVKVQVVRSLVAPNGKVIGKVNGNLSLKSKEKFSKQISQTLGKTLAPGVYTAKVSVLDQKGKKLDENSFTFEIAAPQAKSAASKAVVTSGVTLSGTPQAALTKGGVLKYRYDYVYAGAKTAKVTVVRSVVGTDGKVVQSVKGTLTMKPGERFTKVISEKLPKKLATGTYVSTLVIKNSAGKVETEQSFSFEVK